eukprot:7535474-Pyramimonas_sp.AAC.1
MSLPFSPLSSPSKDYPAMPEYIAFHPEYSVKLELLVSEHGARAPDCSARCRLGAIKSLVLVAAKQ